MTDMLPGTGRAGAAFPGKFGIIARSAAWRKGRGGGARGEEGEGTKNATRPRIGLERSASRLCLWGAQIWQASGLPEGGTPVADRVSYAAKKNFCKDASWQEISLPGKDFPGGGGWCAQNPRRPCAGRWRMYALHTDAGRNKKMRKLLGASANGFSGAGEDPACRRGGHGPGQACCSRGEVPVGEPHGPGARACWAGPCAAAVAVAGDDAAVADRHARDHCYAHSLSPGRRARRAVSGPGHAGA